MVVSTPEQKIKGEESYHHGRGGQDNGTTILLGLKDYKVGVVGEYRVIVKTLAKGKGKRCPYCGSGRLYGHGVCKLNGFYLLSPTG